MDTDRLAGRNPLFPMLFGMIFMAVSCLAVSGCGGGHSSSDISAIPENARLGELSPDQIDALCAWHVDQWGGEGAEFDCPDGSGVRHIGPLEKEVCALVVGQVLPDCEAGTYEQCTRESAGNICVRSQAESCQKLWECAGRKDERVMERAAVFRTFRQGSIACSLENNPDDWATVSCDNAEGKSCRSFKIQKYAFNIGACWAADIFSFSIVGQYITCQNVVSNSGEVLYPIGAYLQNSDASYEWLCSVWQYDEAFNANSYDCSHETYGQQGECCADQSGHNACTLHGP